MMGLGLRAYPLLALLALSQFAGPSRAVERGDAENAPAPPRSAPAEERVHGERRGEAARAPAAASGREPSVALLLLLKDAAGRWHME